MTRQEEALAMHTLVMRHRRGDGFCRCCGQPWPCDVRILSDFFKGWRSKV